MTTIKGFSESFLSAIKTHNLFRPNLMLVYMNVKPKKEEKKEYYDEFQYWIHDKGIDLIIIITNTTIIILKKNIVHAQLLIFRT